MSYINIRMYVYKTVCMCDICGMLKGVNGGEHGCMTIFDLMACLNGCDVILL